MKTDDAGTATLDDYSHTISPISATFFGGSWTSNNVKITSEYTDDKIKATNGGVSSYSGQFTVNAATASSLVVSALGSATAGSTSCVTVTAITGKVPHCDAFSLKFAALYCESIRSLSGFTYSDAFLNGLIEFFLIRLTR